MRPVSLYSDFVQIPPDQTFAGAVFVDDSVGLGTQFLFSHSDGGQVKARVRRPSGTVIAAGSPGYAVNREYSQIRISIADVAEVQGDAYCCRYENISENGKKTLAGPGLEPETSGLTYQRSSHLSYPALDGGGPK